MSKSFRLFETNLFRIVSINFNPRKYRIGKIFLSGFLVVIHIIFNGGISAITLEGFIAQVKSSNPELLAAKSRQQAQVRRIKPAASWEDPFFAAGPDELSFKGGMEYVIRYQLNQTIPFPGKLDARERLTKWQAQNLQADYETMERQFIIGAAQIFFQALLNRKALELNSEYGDLLRITIAGEKSRYDTGGDGHHLWLLASAELEILQIERIRLEKEKNYLQSLMNEIRNKTPENVNGPENENIESIEFSFGMEDEKLPEFDEMLQGQPEYKSALARVSFARENETQSRLGYFPDIMLQGMIMQSVMPNTPSNWGVMAGVTVPLFWFRKQNELVQAAQAENTAAENEKTAVLNKIKTQWLDAHKQLKLAHEIYELYDKKILPLTKMAVDSIKSDYKTRKASIKDLSDTLRIYKVQQLEYTAARLDIEMAKLSIKELLINPGIITFSPRVPTLFNSMNAGMNDSQMNSNKPMRPAGGMKPPKQSGEKSNPMGGM